MSVLDRVTILWLKCFFWFKGIKLRLSYLFHGERLESTEKGLSLLEYCKQVVLRNDQMEGYPRDYETILHDDYIHQVSIDKGFSTRVQSAAFICLSHAIYTKEYGEFVKPIQDDCWLAVLYAASSS